MKMNPTQIKHLKESAILICEDPLPNLTMLWCDWANDNLENCQARDKAMVSVELVLPVIYVFSKLYNCPPKVVYGHMLRELRKRVSLLGFYRKDIIDFKQANLALGEVISELVPVGKKPKRELMN